MKAQLNCTGYSNTREHRRQATIMRPERHKEILALDLAHPYLARGAGHSYGDAALPADGDATLISTTRMDKFLGWDQESLTLRCEAGVDLRNVFNALTPRKAYLPVTPGVSEVTIGGCIASDIHSKNHWRMGGFSRSVKSITLLTARGLLTCSRTQEPELFAATISGYGLTGLIVETELQLTSLPGLILDNHAIPARGHLELFTAYKDATEKHAYAVGWVDFLNDATPRGMVFASDFSATQKEFTPWPAMKRKPLHLISPFFNGFSQSIFNRVFYARHKGAPHAQIPLRPFLFPWDGLPNFNRLYGPQGFYEYQCCVPEEAGLVFFEELTRRIRRHREVPVLFAAFKRMGMSEGMMSYPFPGYSFLLDVHASAKAREFLDSLDEMVIAHQGRVNLSKDARLSATTVRTMYPQLDAFLATIRHFNPAGLKASAMAQRFAWNAGDRA